MASSTLKANEDQFREYVAEELRGIGAGHVTVHHDRVVLELESGSEGTLRVVAGFNEDHIGRSGWGDWLQLRIETADQTTPLLTLGWLGADEEALAASLGARVDPGLPPDQRGLNAAADIREGRYARGDAVALLRAEIGAAAGHSAAHSSRALTTFSAPERRAARLRPVEAASGGVTLDADFTAVSSATAARIEDRNPPLEELRELLIARTFELMQQELFRREGQVAGAGVLSSAKRNFLEAVE
jgi:hypothetical protein